ncbi:serine protease [Streptomyces sp. ISL-11]|uniref:serine protease n=1 Tax=Streptomyces sp. ISL-11 TaxID=2819174 RepID=UPI001BE84E16|nr:serine protease [Streptomyces sp. ISL-11]MBT2382701.1 NACHT domain-containing protein [Streptomyces sp. ISL-11]
MEDRLVAVLAEAQGSGVLLTASLVLTSAHVLGGEGGVRVVALGHAGPVLCEVLWAGDPEQCDAALLLAGRPLLPAADLPPLRWGVCVGRSPVDGCQALGFPQVQRYGREELEAVQIPGTLAPLSGVLRGRYVLRAAHPPPSTGPYGSPWAGLSGGPVFAGPVLVGIATEDPKGWAHSSIDAVPMASILEDTQFQARVEEHWPRAPHLEQVHSAGPEDNGYEATYAEAIKAAYSRLEIFGLDDLGTGDTNWDLDTAYLSLEAQATRPGREQARSGPQRVEGLLGSRPRTLLRGEAGAGKTTLVWWLASHAACNTLSAELSALNGLVPFVIPMRTLAAQGITRPTPSQLPTIARLSGVDTPPSGWAGRVLAAGRALLLVDGLDELPQADRAPARKWLAELLRMHPRTRCLVTVRPLAVDQAWLESEGFEELRLLPMSNRDIQTFVAAWHAAARLECDGYADKRHAERLRSRLQDLERDLTQEFQRNAALRDLARTPLLCAVICALHRRRSGLLPRTRWELYRAALNMLLGSRDAHRRVHKPEGIELEPDDGRQLLQRIAIWLVRNGRTELSRAQAVRQLELAMAGLRRIRQQGTAGEVLTHLLNRSGLLQERTADSIQFIHRTFQDYLAAKEFQDSDSLDELLGHVAEEQWQDVIRLVIGHCGRKEEERVIDALIAAGRSASREDAWSVRTLAAQCAISAASLDDTRHAAVWEGLRELGAPRRTSEIDHLASLGPEVLGILPGPDGLDDTEARHVVRVLTPLGDAAKPLLKRYGQHEDLFVRTAVAHAWTFSVARRYAREVLAPMRLDDLNIMVGSAEQLACLPDIGPVLTLSIEYDGSADLLRPALRGRKVTRLILGTNRHITDLGFLGEHPEIEYLSIMDCPQLRDVSALTGTHLRELHLGLFGSRALLDHLEVLDGALELSFLGVADLPSTGGCGSLPPPLSGVSRLMVTDSDPLSLEGIEGWTGLRQLMLPTSLASSHELNRLGSLHGLTSLQLNSSMDDLAGADPLPQITEVALCLTEPSSVDGRLLRVFPGLRSLHLEHLGSGAITVDLTTVRELPGETLALSTTPGQGLTVLGADAFGERLIHS